MISSFPVSSTSGRRPLGAGLLAAALGLGACSGLPEPAELSPEPPLRAAPPAATVGGPQEAPGVEPDAAPGRSQGAAQPVAPPPPAPAPLALDGPILRRDGQPFLPIGVWRPPPREGHLRHLASLGINTLLANGQEPAAATNPRLLALCQELGLVAFLAPDAGAAGHPALAGWLLGDEPDGRGIPPEMVAGWAESARALDPTRPVVLNLTGNFLSKPPPHSGEEVALYRGYAAIADVVSFDFYPVTGWNRPDWIARPGAAAALLRGELTDGSKPVWAILEASDQRLSWTPPETTGPSPAQLRFEAFDAIVRGATGIAWFTIAFEPFEWSHLTPEVERELTRTNGQLTELADVLLGEDSELSFRVEGPGSDALHLAAREARGAHWIIATHAEPGERGAELTLTFERAPAGVVEYLEGQPVELEGAQLRAELEPLGVRVWRIEG